MSDLSNKDFREQLEDRIKNDIDEWCQKEFQGEPREHLGASIMGHPCSRYLWAHFRWLKQEQFSGRMLRLFNVGHHAEPRLITYLRGIGFEVWERDPQTNKQFRIEAHNGHYGGSLDGICKAPAHYNLSQDLVFLNEFKTNGTGKGFTDVESLGLQKAKPRHYAQMCQYGLYYKLKYGIYIIENKNDSDLIIKIVELDWKIGQEYINKAGDIINSQYPPARIAESPSYFECKYCTFQGICFNNEPVENNCRSCKYSAPIENGEWKCNRWNTVIPKEQIGKEKDCHVSIVV